MAVDNFDYNIVFPDAGTSETHWRGTKEPVVILLGWAGCKDKHLSKYSSIYNEQGCVTIRFTAPLKTVFISESLGYKELNNTALKLLNILYEYDVENSPVFFHVFSNGGFMVYRYIVELLLSNKHFSSLQVMGAVVDSAPGGGNIIGALRALKVTLGPQISPLMKYVMLAVFALSIFFLRVVLYPLTKFIHKNHYDAMKDSPPPWPHLYLYSRADRVIRHADVELFMDTLMKKGVNVEGHDFASSAHVSHFRDFPEIYSRKCHDFLVTCMKDLEGSKTKRRQQIQTQ